MRRIWTGREISKVAVWWFTVTITGAISGIQVAGHSQAWPTLAECEERRGAAISLLSTTLAVSDLIYGVSGCEDQMAASSLRQPGKGQ